MQLGYSPDYRMVLCIPFNSRRPYLPRQSLTPHTHPHSSRPRISLYPPTEEEEEGEEEEEEEEEEEAEEEEEVQ